MPGTRGRGNGESVFNGDRVSAEENEKVTDGDEGCTTIRMYLMQLNCTLKNGQMLNFIFIIYYIYISPQ